MKRSVPLFLSVGASLVVLVVLVTAGCAGNNNGSTSGTSLTGTQWVATAYNDGKTGLQSLAPDTLITALFGTNGDVQGNATVNEYTTKYTVTDAGKMTISDQIQSTQMAGPEASMAQEHAYLAALPKTASYTIEGDKLTLKDASEAALVEYVVKGTAK